MKSFMENFSLLKGIDPMRKKIGLAFIAASLCLSACAVTEGNWMRPDQVKSIIEDRENAAKALQEMKNKPVGTDLAAAYEMYIRLKASTSEDPALKDSLEKRRQVFFDKWMKNSEAMCDKVDYDGYLVADFRMIYEAMLQNLIVTGKLSQGDSRYMVLPKSIPFRELTAVDMDEFDDEFKHANSYVKKEKESVCIEYRFAKRDWLMLNDDYVDVLNAFMGVKKDSYFSAGEVKNHIEFLKPMMPVAEYNEGENFHYESFPAINYIYINDDHDIAKVSVRESSKGGTYYYLKKKNDEWKVVKAGEGWKD